MTVIHNNCEETDRVVSLTRDLVRIRSVNPAYPGGNGEADVARYVERWGQNAGFMVTRQPVSPGRDNILVTLPVANAPATLLFEAHMDTVALDPMGEAGLEPIVRDGKLYGRGACDTKGSLAAMMTAMEQLRERHDELRVNVTLLASVDEEYAFTGVLGFIASDAPATYAVVGEPTDLRVVVAHKGCVRGTIHTLGRAAHSSEPERGLNAIDAMADVIATLRELSPRLGKRSHPLLNSPTFSVGVIEGGTGVNIVPERCTIQYDRRTLPGERTEDVLAELDALLDVVRQQRPDIVIERPAPRLISEGLDTPPDTEIAQIAKDACIARGLDGTPLGVNYGSDASKLQHRRGIPAIVLGPGSITQAHGDNEFVPVSALQQAAHIYATIALSCHGGA